VAVVFFAVTLIFVLVFWGWKNLLENKNKDDFSGKIGSNNKFLESYYQNAEDYKKSFSTAAEMKKIEILGGVTSHHFLARDLIAHFFAGIDPQKVERVILVGPDHFHRFSASDDHLAEVSKMSWKTPFGEVRADEKIIDEIVKSSIDIKEDSRLFYEEHSIYTLVPFLRYYLPKAKIVPLIVRNDNRLFELGDLGKKVYEISGEGSIVIVSSDFSHEAEIQEAKISDQNSISKLNNLNIKTIGSIKNDCSNCIAFLSGFLRNNQKEFFLLENKTSADFGSKEKTVTSYVSGYYLPIK